MSSITYTDNVTVIPAAWLNDVNSVAYTLFGDGSSYTGTLTIASAASAIFGTTHKWYMFNDGTYTHMNNASSGGQEGIRASTTEIALLVGGTAVLTATSSALSSIDNSLTIASGTAIPAGGNTGVGYSFSSTGNFGVFFGSGAPSLNAAKGSLYLRSDGSSTSTRAYINTDGGTTWTAITTAA